MRARWVLLGVGVALTGGAAAAPEGARMLARDRGWEIAEAGWCREGLCLTTISRGESRADTAVVRWDRTVKVTGVDVARGSGATSAATRGAGWVRGVEVEDLHVVGVPLPALSGTLRPEVRLSGEGVSVEGEVVRYDSPWGEVEIRLGSTLEARCPACRVALPSLSPTPIDLPPARAIGVVTGDRFAGTVRIGDVEAEIEAGMGGGTARFTDVPVAALYEVLAPVLPEVAHARILGTFSGTFPFRVPGPEVDAPEVSVTGVSVDGLVSGDLAEGVFRYPARDVAGEQGFRACGEGTPDWLPLRAMGRLLPAAVIAAEDSQFLAHPGFDLPGMVTAATENAAAGEIVRGGSTLTQQLAKNLFLSGERTYARKLSELLFAVELERELGKNRILELYLNIVEWGPGIHGAKQAARAYFLKAPAGLLPEEAAFLASILRNPRTAWRTQYVRGRPGEQRVRWILGNMVGFDRAELDAAAERTVHFVPPK